MKRLSGRIPRNRQTIYLCPISYILPRSFHHVVGPWSPIPIVKYSCLDLEMIFDLYTVAITL